MSTLSPQSTAAVMPAEPFPPSAWAFLIFHHLLVYTAYMAVSYFVMGLLDLFIGAAAISLIFLMGTTQWLMEMVTPVTGQAKTRYLAVGGYWGSIYLILLLSLWITPVPFLLACLVSLGVAALGHIVVDIGRPRHLPHWQPLTTVQEIVCAGRYQLGDCQIKITSLRDGFHLLLTYRNQQVEYRFADLPTLLLYLEAILPAVERSGDSISEIQYRSNDALSQV
jgi:hypothetical protein